MPFPLWTNGSNRNEDVCWLTYTNKETHEIIKAIFIVLLCIAVKLKVLARYCPSIEDKVVRFADKERHQLFVEPEGTGTNEMYVQGMSTSLPMDVQYAFLRTIPGVLKTSKSCVLPMLLNTIA